MAKKRNAEEYKSDFAALPVGGIRYWFVVLLLFVSFALLVWVYFFNVPLIDTDQQTGSNMGILGWLVEVHSGGTVYGFGVWGICSWSEVGDGDTTCWKSGFWTVPKTASDGPTAGLTLPSAIANSLGAAGALLIFPLLQHLTFMLVYLGTVHVPLVEQPPRRAIYDLPNGTKQNRLIWPWTVVDGEPRSKRLWCARFVRQPLYTAVWLSLNAIFVLAAFICAYVGKGQVDETYVARIGRGTSFLIGFLVVEIVVVIITQVWGVWLPTLAVRNAMRRGVFQ